MHKHLVRLTPLRFVAAMSVVLFHFGRGIPPFYDSYFSEVLANGHVAVSFFFCLSGFIMASVYGGSAVSAKDYWIARFARIYPLYIFAVAMTLLLGGRYSWQTILLSILMLQAWVPGQGLALNAPGWSLSVEVFFYAIFPLLIRWLSNRTARRFGIISLCLWVATQFFAGQVIYDLDSELMRKTQNFLLGFPPLHLDQFLLGAAAGALFTPINEHRAGGHRLSTGALVLLSGVAVTYLSAGLCMLFGGAAMRIMGNDAPVFVGIIWLVACAPARWARPLEWRPLITLGEASYAIYLLQMPARSLFEGLLAPLTSRLSPTVHLAAYVGFLILLSLAVHLTIERPARRWIKGRFQKNEDAAAAVEAGGVGTPVRAPAE